MCMQTRRALLKGDYEFGCVDVPLQGTRASPP